MPVCGTGRPRNPHAAWLGEPARLNPLVESACLVRLNEERLRATVRDRQALRMVIKTKAQEEAEQRPSTYPDNVARLRRAFGEPTQVSAGPVIERRSSSRAL
jgi:hypothetical protein